jgi:hypothetical protein
MNASQESSWTHAHEQILKEWKAKAFAYMWLQSNSCYFYIRLHNWLAYLVIILSSFASATMFSLNSSGDSCQTPIAGIPIIVVQYVVGTVSLLSAILTGVIRQLKPGEMYQQHASTAKRYHSLIRSIDACLSLTSVLRPDPALFIEKAGTELDNLANNQIDPPLSVVKRFERVYGPLERILYGEDVVELWKITYQTSKLEARMKKSISTTGIHTSEDDKKDNESTDQIDTAYKSTMYSSQQPTQEDKLENIVIQTPEDNVEQANGRKTAHTGGGAFVLQSINEPFRAAVLRQTNTFKTM